MARQTRAHARKVALLGGTQRRGGALLVDPDGLTLDGGLAPAREPPQPAHERHPIPVQVVRQPLAELEVALAGRPVAPRGRQLGDAAIEQRCLDGQLKGQLEAGGALDRDRLQVATASRA